MIHFFLNYLLFQVNYHEKQQIKGNFIFTNSILQINNGFD